MHEEAALALGATRWEVIRLSVLPFARSGIISASMLGLGRALGETMAVATVLSASPVLSAHILDPVGGTFAQNIAAKFGEADELRPGRADRLRPGALRDHPAGQRRGAADHRPPQGVLGGQRMSDTTLTRNARPEPGTPPPGHPPAAPLGPGRHRPGRARRRLPVSAPAPGLTSHIQWGLIALVALRRRLVRRHRPGRGPPPGQGPGRHQPGLGLLPPRRHPAVLADPDDRQQGCGGPRRHLPDPLDERRARPSSPAAASTTPSSARWSRSGIAPARSPCRIGLLTAIYLVEYGRGTLAKAVTFFVDVMTGIPSIVAGLFILSFWILILGFGPPPASPARWRWRS